MSDVVAAACGLQLYCCSRTVLSDFSRRFSGHGSLLI